jgi:hypothetical protein
MHLLPLPPEVHQLLLETNAPPRLAAHLALVHDVACQLVARVANAWPGMIIDQRAVRLGAAIHDIGKVVHARELSEPGHEHELAGKELLTKYGWPESLSRFAVTHGAWLGPTDPIEDLLVKVSDKVWKGSRHEGLEQALVAHIASVTGEESRQVWMTLDDILTSLADAAPERLAWQASHPV